MHLRGATQISGRCRSEKSYFPNILFLTTA